MSCIIYGHTSMRSLVAAKLASLIVFAEQMCLRRQLLLPLLCCCQKPAPMLCAEWRSPMLRHGWARWWRLGRLMFLLDRKATLQIRVVRDDRRASAGNSNGMHLTMCVVLKLPESRSL